VGCLILRFSRSQTMLHLVFFTFSYCVRAAFATCCHASIYRVTLPRYSSCSQHAVADAVWAVKTACDADKPLGWSFVEQLQFDVPSSSERVSRSVSIIRTPLTAVGECRQMTKRGRPPGRQIAHPHLWVVGGAPRYR
jgi:hypothetical protein